jgi:RNA polymerase sigma factor (sigma-70 family)
MSAVKRETSDGLDGLFRSRWGPSVRLATVLTSDRAVAEELVQEAFLEVMQRWDGVDNPEGYLRTVVVNRCRNHQRHLGVGRRRTPPPAPPLTVDAPELDELWAALARLQPRRRMALVLRFYEDLPIGEIARLLDCRPGTVSSLLHRGLADLRKVLDDVA